MATDLHPNVVEAEAREAAPALEIPEVPGLCYFLVLFIRMRWLAGSAAALSAVVFQLFVESTFNYTGIYLTVSAIFLYNLWFWAQARRNHSNIALSELADAPELPSSRMVAIEQITLDLLALFMLVHVSGGLESPFILFFVFHVAISGILLKPKIALLETSFAVLLVFLLGILEKVGVVEHYQSAAIIGNGDFAQSWLFVLGLSSVLGITMYSLCLLTIIIMRERRRRHERVLVLTRDLHELNIKLREIDTMRRGLLAVASHDLKSPINAVASFMMLLSDGYLGELNKKQRNVIHKSLDRLKGLNVFIADVLSLTAIDSGRLRHEMEEQDIVPILNQVVENHQDSAQQRDITLSYEHPESLKARFAAPRIAQVFENLISNAVKYTLEGGEVLVRLTKEGENFLFQVEDSGIGMSSEEMAKLFQDFYRAQSVKKKFEGTGLGLSVVRRIVQTHQGKVWAESVKGEGSTFYVVVPISGGA